MGIDYSTFIAYGQVVKPKQEDKLAEILNDFAYDDVETLNELINRGVDERKVKKSYPLLRIESNVDGMTGKVLSPALIVCIESSIVDLYIRESQDLHKLPLRVTSQKLAAEGKAQLEKFCKDYSLKSENNDWIVFATIS